MLEHWGEEEHRERQRERDPESPLKAADCVTCVATLVVSMTGLIDCAMNRGVHMMMVFRLVHGAVARFMV
jgi:hypothetical protein